MTDLLPDVSVVIPTQNRIQLLCRAIESCSEAADGRVTVEVLVVDDGSTDGTDSVVRERYPWVRLLTNATPNGRGRARNRGLDAARGVFVKFLDDDDWLDAGALRDEVGYALEQEATIVAGGHRYVEDDGTVCVEHAPPPLDRGIDSLLDGEAVPTAAALYRREELRGVRWSEHEAKLDDWLFFVEAALKAKRIVPIKRIVYTYRGHRQQGVRRISMHTNAVSFYHVLDRLETALRALQQATPERLRRLAQYRYKELRVLCLHDRQRFEDEVVRIKSLDPTFEPFDEERQVWMRVLSRFLGFRRAVLLHSVLKKALRRLPA